MNKAAEDVTMTFNGEYSYCKSYEDAHTLAQIGEDAQFDIGPFYIIKDKKEDAWITKYDFESTAEFIHDHPESSVSYVEYKGKTYVAWGVIYLEFLRDLYGQVVSGIINRDLSIRDDECISPATGYEIVQHEASLSLHNMTYRAENFLIPGNHIRLNVYCRFKNEPEELRYSIDVW